MTGTFVKSCPDCQAVRSGGGHICLSPAPAAGPTPHRWASLAAAAAAAGDYPAVTAADVTLLLCGAPQSGPPSGGVTHPGGGPATRPGGPSPAARPEGGQRQ